MAIPLTRTELLLGAEAVQRLSRARVLLFGLGGVGSYAAEALARSGIGHLTLVDHDVVGESNLNRQLGALHSTIGRSKVEVLRERIRDINPTLEVECIQLFYRPEEAAQIDFGSYDYILDAIDTVRAKADVVQRAFAAGVPVICCMGMGNRMDPTAVRVGDLAATSVCPLCRAMRRKLRREGIEHVRVVYSVETPIEVPEVHDFDEHSTAKRPTPGSAVFVPAAAGMALAAEAVRDLANGTPTRPAQKGFSLVEVLVALSLVGFVLVPAVLQLNRFLRDDHRLESAISLQLRERENPPCPVYPPSSQP